MRATRLLCTVSAAAALAAAGCSSSKATSPPAATAGPGTTPGPVAGGSACRGSAPPAHVEHVVWIVMENRGLAAIDGSPSAPYLNRLGRECGLATNYSDAAHPSLPNYIAMTSGSTQGVTDDADPSSHHLAAASIFSLLGSGWRSLEESMPIPCDKTGSGNYAPKHNPAVYYTDLGPECAAQDVPLDDARPDVSARFTFITPNLCNDMHDCSTATGDAWLSRELPLVLDSAEYRSGTTVVFITWDEDDSGGNRVATYVLAPSVVPRTRSHRAFDHYSLLRTTEELLGLQPLLGQAASAPSMTGAFHL